MSDKQWMTFLVPGLGDLAAWLDPESVDVGEQYIEVESLTQVLIGTGGQIGLRKVADSARINLALVFFSGVTPDEMKEHLAKTWSQRTIIRATGRDLPRIKPAND